jgi:hypothetical protein
MKNVKKNVIILMLATLAVWATFSCQKDKEEVFENVKSEEVDLEQLANDFTKNLSNFTPEKATEFYNDVQARYKSLSSEQLMAFYKINLNRAEAKQKSGEENSLMGFTKETILKSVGKMVEESEKQFGKSYNELTQEENEKLMNYLYPSEKLEGKTEKAGSCPIQYFPMQLSYSQTGVPIGNFYGLTAVTKLSYINNMPVPQNDCDTEVIYKLYSSRTPTKFIAYSVIAYAFLSEYNPYGTARRIRYSGSYELRAIVGTGRLQAHLAMGLKPSDIKVGY